MAKNPRKKLSAKQCPRCGYNGTKKIMAGPNKGKKISKGFGAYQRTTAEKYNRKKTKKQIFVTEYMHCPQCEYTEKRNTRKYQL